MPATRKALDEAHRKARQVFRPGVVQVPGGQNIHRWAARERARAFKIEVVDDGEKTPVDTLTEERAPGYVPFLDSPLAAKLVIGAAAVGIGYFAGRWWKKHSKPEQPKLKLVPISEVPSWAMT